MASGNEQGSQRSHARRAAYAVGVITLCLSLVPTAAAHSGTTHAGIPHIALFALFTTGLFVAGGAVLGVRSGRIRNRVGILGVLGGGAIAMLGAIGLVEIQVTAPTGPQFQAFYEPASVILGSALMLGGLVIGWFRWRERPRYTALTTLLGAWIMYPAIMPNEGILHPLGYLLVLALPVTIGYILYTDALDTIRRVIADDQSRRVGLVAGGLFTVFFAFSAGTISLNPDIGVNTPTTSTITTVRLVDPLVYWPAVEFYFPNIPLAGFVSVGTLLLFGLMATLVGLNMGVVMDEWSRAESGENASFAGSLAASGATACCCCAPAIYGVLSAVLGAAATPVYWAFMDPTSPVGGVFLAGSIILLLQGILRSERRTRTTADHGESSGRVSRWLSLNSPE
jgi:hypothetical protein